MNKSIFILFLFFSFVATAQLSRFRAGQRQFNAMSYTDAAINLKTYIDNTKENSDTKLEALRMLGQCYKNLQDTQNSENIFAIIINNYKDKVESDDYLFYAQALASNGNYRESQKYYSIYGQEQKADLRGRKFTVAYMDKSGFYKDSSNYKVNYLYPINSKQSDFAPMYYEDGIVFVSARDEGGIIKRVFKQNNTPFLDLFLFPDTAKLNRRNSEILETASLGGSNNEIGQIEEGNLVISGSEEDIDEFSKKINTKYHEGPVTFFKDYRRLIFTRNNYKGKRGKSSDGITKLKLYLSTKEGDKWKDIKELPFNSDEYSCGHPALNLTDDVLYFASDMPGGYGGTDLYKVTFRNNLWGKPENLGPEINTEGSELYPYLDEAGNLYFASDGQPGLGGLDIFYMNMRDDKPVGIVENVGAPINSEKDDFGIIANGARTEGYFSSNRKKGLSDDNIYSFIKSCRQLNILVYDKKTNSPINEADLRVAKNGVNQELLYTDSKGGVSICLENGSNFEFIAYKDGFLSSGFTYGTNANNRGSKSEVIIYLEKSKRPIITGLVLGQQSKNLLSGARVILKNLETNQEETQITGPDGKYQFQPEDNGKYEIIVTADGFAKNTVNLGKVRQTWLVNTVYEQNIPMLAKGDIIKIENIYYDFDKYAIRRDARKSLNEQVLEVMEKYPSLTIELRSHTDSRGPKTYNKTLSQKRAQAVINYLASKGINKNRLVAKGFGEELPVNGCVDGVSCSNDQHQENRRTEFRIINIE